MPGAGSRLAAGPLKVLDKKPDSIRVKACSLRSYERITLARLGGKQVGRRMTLKVILADDHPLKLQGIRGALEEGGDIQVVGQTYSGAEVLPLIRETEPHVALIDIRIAGVVDGMACLDLIRKHHPEIKVIMLSASHESQEIETALERGASACITKSVNPRDLPSAIRQAVQRTVFHARPHGSLNGHSPSRDLTARELQTVAAVARGLSNKAISRELCVTEQTVKFHLTNIYRKLRVPNRTSVVRYAHEHGLVELEPQRATALASRS